MEHNTLIRTQDGKLHTVSSAKDLNSIGFHTMTSMDNFIFIKKDNKLKQIYHSHHIELIDKVFNQLKKSIKDKKTQFVDVQRLEDKILNKTKE